MPDLKASVSFTADGTTKKYYFNFDYINPEYIKVNIGGTELSYPSDYSVIDRAVELKVVPAKDTLIEIKRETPTDRLIQWADGSFIKSSQMSLENIQQLHLIEELQDYIVENYLVLDDAKNSANTARLWAQSAASPDGDTDTDSPTGKTQSSKSWALYSKEKAQVSKQYAEEAYNSEQGALQSASSASSSAYEAARAAAQAEQSAQTTLPDAYDSSKTYSFPDVVVYQDGNTYRCIGTEVTGEDPKTSHNWVLVSTVYGDFFDLDTEGALMPALNPIYSNDFEIDDDGNIMPKE